VQSFARSLATLTGDVRSLRGSLTALDRARALAPEMVHQRPPLAGELRSLAEVASKLAAELEG
jgi:hypothetical protein